mgnify:CR=1 FL=1
MPISNITVALAPPVFLVIFILPQTCFNLEYKPNIACLPSSHCVGASVIKNWDPFVLGPEFAIDIIPAPEIIKMSIMGLKMFTQKNRYDLLVGQKKRKEYIQKIIIRM